MPGIAFELTDRVREQIKAMLPFKPTGAQKRVLGEIASDMTAPRPMNRLLQGDVGSGKTIVAAEAAVIAIENGYQVAVLAPTEILATQHYFYFKQLLAKLGYVTVLLTGSFSDREKVAAEEAAGGGTGARGRRHARAARKGRRVQASWAWPLIDEQHRFGVMQRLGLVQKGVHPDVLVMTATPIPRTLALTLYGDLDVSVIDELPPGRKPIVTKHVTADHVEQVYSFLKKQIDAGTAGVRGVSGDRGIGNAGDEGGGEDVRAPLARGLSGSRGRADARAACRGRKGSRDGALQARARSRFWSRPR